MKRKSNNPIVSTLSGAIAGGIEATVIWPTEYTKTLLQLDKSSTVKKYNGIIDCAKQQIKKNGPLSLYRGLVPTLTFAIPKAGIRFGGYNYFNNIIKNNTNEGNETVKSLFAGIGAGFSEAVLVVTPQETIKTKLIESNYGFYNGVKSIINESGYKGLYKGLLPTIIKQSSNQGIRFMTYGTYKNVILNNYNEITSLQSLFGGMISGFTSTMLNNPIDMIKTRMQGIESNEYKSTMDCIKKVYQKEGFMAFYKGVGARLLRVVPGQGIVFASYEHISNNLEKVFDKNN